LSSIQPSTPLGIPPGPSTVRSITPAALHLKRAQLDTSGMPEVRKLNIRELAHLNHAGVHSGRTSQALTS
jgi:hypothetical protein